MLTITIPEHELFDQTDSSFRTLETKTIELEHSLVSLSKWESKWNKPFLSKEKISDEETLDYILCMTLTPNITIEDIFGITNTDIDRINEYIQAPMTATKINELEKGRGTEIVTSELIYYWMISLNIPFSCENWHLTRLTTLIKVCSAKNAPPKKMSKREAMERNKALNEQRRKAMNSKG